MHPAYRRALPDLMRQRPLDRDAAEALAHASLTGQLPEAATAAWLTALQLKGLTAAELTGVVGAVRGLMRRVVLPGDGPVIDTGGTGGSGLDTLNTSTMAGLVCAAAGVTVARQVAPKGRGRCGAADVLAHLGVNLDLTAPEAEALAATQPFVVLPRPAHHPALTALDGLRGAIGLPTVLDVVAPLCNPAGARHHLIGVADDRLGPLVVQALKTLGSQRAMVVHGVTGLDELALSSPTRFWELWDDGSIHRGVLTPEDLGLTRAPFFHMRGGGPAANAQRFVAILKGEDDTPAAEHVALNAGAALYVAGAAADLELGVARARSILTTGAAYAVFDAWRAASHEGPEAADP